MNVPTSLKVCSNTAPESMLPLSKRLPGPDHAFAIDPAGLKALVDGVRAVERVLGTGLKEVHGVEDELRAFARRSLFTTRAVSAGEVTLNGEPYVWEPADMVMWLDREPQEDPAAEAERQRSRFVWQPAR